MTALDYALWLDSLGLCVIPIPRPDGRHDGKVPAILWREFQTRHPTENEIRGWFGDTPLNLAIVTGAISGVVVVDLDDEAARHWWIHHRPYSPWQIRTSKGWHIYYRHPGLPVTNRGRLDTVDGRLAIDVRGDGGYAIAPGSVHASGAIYRQAGDWTTTREALPRFWPGWLTRSRSRSSSGRRSTARSSPDLIARARAYLASRPAPTIGAGSDVATFHAACRLVRGFGLAAVDAEELLWTWAGGRPGWTRTWVARKVLHARRYGTEPIGGLLA
jgi:hypothetical protein